MKIPAAVQDKLSELENLCKKNPLRIPVVEAADFLGMDGDSLRACIECGACPFGIGWKKKNARSRAFYIPTTTFYLWFTQSVGYREG